MDLQFSIGGMEELHSQAVAYKNQFDNAIHNLDDAINELSGYWTSEEVGTYQAFLNLYKEKRSILIEALNYMNQFCIKTETKKEDFETAANTVKKSFE